MNWFNRREFLERTAILGAASAALGLPTAQAKDEPSAKKGSANDRLKVAVVGVHGRGMSHVGGFLNKNANCEIVAICDADTAVIGKAMSAVQKAQGAEPKFVQDFRKLIEDKSIDVISIATPNHWHATMAVWAMRAGKDVYCEKPATHNVHEGRLMAEASRKYNKICQVGTQSRSNPGMRDSIKYIHDGKIGKVSVAYGTCYKPRKSIGKVSGDQEPPKTMDYDLWCGPAPLKPPHRKTGSGTVHYDWHWFWDYGNGDYGNQGVHEADKARWGLNLPGLPTSVGSVGGRFGYVDDGETPNTQLCLYEYPGAHLMFEVRGLDTKDYKGAKVGNIWFGDKGYVVCPNYGSGIAYDPDGKEVARFNGGGDQHHFDNFLKAVRARDHKLLNCDVEEGHLSAALCHLGNISYRLGRETVIGDDIRTFEKVLPASEAFERMKAHLEDNKVDKGTAKCLVGTKLTIDPKTEKFTAATDGADVKKANAMLFREYRKGFDIAEKA
ncbi:MAG: Gfo/Idh/MocA family oxidoreductase [Gemmataceae bacterium]